MPLAIDMLVGFFTSTTFIMIIGHHLAPEPIRSVFTTILTVKARGHLGDVISVESTGHCHLDHERAPCSEVILTLLQQGLSGYESSEELFLLADESRVLAGLQEFLLTSNTIFHGVLLVTCYALLAFAWESTSEVECPSFVRTALRPLKRFVVFTMAIATLCGIITTAAGLAVALRLSSLVREHSQAKASHDFHIGSGWVLPLCATLGCLFATMTACEHLLSSSEVREGQITLGEEDEELAPDWREKSSAGESSSSVCYDLAMA